MGAPLSFNSKGPRRWRLLTPHFTGQGIQAGELKISPVPNDAIGPATFLLKEPF